MPQELKHRSSRHCRLQALMDLILRMCRVILHRRAGYKSFKTPVSILAFQPALFWKG